MSRRSRRWLIVVGVLAVLLIAARLALPYAVKRYVNDTLNKIPDYRGHVDDIRVSLWRGAYTIRGVSLEKTSGKVPVPLFKAPEVDLSVDWSELFHGAVVGAIVVTRPEVNFVAGPSEDAKQTGIDSSWIDSVKKLLPVRINRLEIRNGSVHYRDFHSDPKVNVHMDEVQATALHLTNRPKNAEERFATVDATGRPLGHGHFELTVRLNPLEDPPPWELHAALNDLRLASINDFLKAYGNFEVEAGTFSAYTDLATTKGHYDGYVKPLFKDIKIKHEEHASLPHKIYEDLAQFAANILKSHKTEAVATRIPMKGSLDDPHADIWATIGGLLRNAFIRAFRPGFEGGTAGEGQSTGAAEAKAKQKDEKKGGNLAEQKSTDKKPEKEKKTHD